MYLKQYKTYQPPTPDQIASLLQIDPVEAENWFYENVPSRWHRYVDAIEFEDPEEIPMSADELEAALDDAGVYGPKRGRLRGAFAAGSILFIVGGLYMTRSRRVVDFPRGAVEALIKSGMAMMRMEISLLQSGAITLSMWEYRSMRLLRMMYSAAGLLAGRRLESVAQALAAQYALFGSMVTEIATGSQRMASLFRRARRYISFTRAMYYLSVGLSLVEEGFEEERNILGVAEHCGGCVAETERGWVIKGDLVPIGARDCGGECKCSIEHRRGSLIVRA
jgi:hypothetical protein